MPLGPQPRRARGTVGHPYSALNLRLVLAAFGLVASAVLAGRRYAAPADPPRGVQEFLQVRTQPLGILVRQVDFVVASVHPERDGLIGLTAIRVVEEFDFYFASHPGSPASDRHPSRNM